MKIKHSRSCWVHETCGALGERRRRHDSLQSVNSMNFGEPHNVKLEAEMSQLGLGEEQAGPQWYRQQQQQQQQQQQPQQKQQMDATAKDCEGENDCDCEDCCGQTVPGGPPPNPWNYPPNAGFGQGSFGVPYGGWYGGGMSPPYGAAPWNSPNVMPGYMGPQYGMEWMNQSGLGPGGIGPGGMSPGRPDPWTFPQPGRGEGFGVSSESMGSGKPGPHDADDSSEDEHEDMARGSGSPILPRLMARYARLRQRIDNTTGPKKLKLQRRHQLLAKKISGFQRGYRFQQMGMPMGPFPAAPMMVGYPGYWPPPPTMMRYGAPMNYPGISPMRARLLRRVATLRAKGLLFNWKFWKDWWMRRFGPPKRADGTYNWKAWRQFWAGQFSGGASEGDGPRAPIASPGPSMAGSSPARDADMHDAHSGVRDPKPDHNAEGEAKDDGVPPWFQMMQQMTKAQGDPGNAHQASWPAAAAAAASSSAPSTSTYDPQMMGLSPQEADIDPDRPVLSEFVSAVRQGVEKWTKVKEQMSQSEEDSQQTGQQTACKNCGHCGAAK